MNTTLLQFQKRLSELAKNYREHWQERLCDSEDIETYGLNEFVGGKADAFEECLELLRRYLREDCKDTDSWER